MSGDVMAYIDEAGRKAWDVPGIDEATPRRGIETDAALRTSNKRVYAAGDIAAGKEHAGQDTSTLEDFSVLARLRESKES